ncbi:MAG TPA: dihydropyrimidinase [Elusimicrobia bacterium]|nr:dihydropyrimidinase [Elusimicrobiota bacterium]
MGFDLIVKGGTLVSEVGFARSDIAVRAGRVAALGKKLDERGARTLDASGCFVVPGGVDAHTHFDLPFGRTTTADDFKTGSLAAACGGTTTILDFATQERGRPLKQALEEWRRKAEGRCHVDYGFHLAVVDLPESRLRELDWAVRAGCPSFKFYMAYPGRLMLDDGAIARAMLRLQDIGGLASVHAENGGLIDVLVRRALREGRRAPRWHPLTRPPAAEAEAVHRAIVLAEVTGCPLYVVHVSTAEGAGEIRRARERGLRVYGETCPQYLFLSDREYRRPGFEGAKFVMSPPLRPEGHPRRLWDALRQNWLQVVATDHCSFNYRKGRGASKQLGRKDFSRIPNGAPGVETRLPLLWDAVERGDLSPARFVELVSADPARLFGLYPRKGCLAPGSDADLAVLDPRKARLLSAKTHHANVDYSPYEGRRVRAWVRDVLLRGRPLVRSGEPVGGSPGGAFLERKPLGA